MEMTNTTIDIRTVRAKITARFPDRVKEVESEAMDDGRFFVHLRAPWGYNEGYGPGQRTKSFGGLREAYAILKAVEREEA
jgi:hypothetical protein